MDLKKGLSQTSGDGLSKAVKKIDSLAESDYADAQRANKHNLSLNWTTMKSWLHWVIFAVGVILLIAAVSALLILLWVYISSVMQSPELTKELLSSIWNTVLIVGATLFIESKFGRE